MRNIFCSKIRTNKKLEYLNIAASLDIETSSTTTNGNKFAFMYIWMLGIGHGNKVIYGRNWEQLRELLTKIKNHLELNESKRLVLYVHNLGYEFQFMRNEFNFSEVFAISERKPIKALLNGAFELRCSYILSGFSLENTAKNLVKYKVEKAVGDLDYDKIRHHDTKLTKQELHYCESDIRVVNAYIQEQIEYYGDITKIPMTNTGRVRKFVRQKCYYTSNEHKKTSYGKYSRYRNIMRDLTLTPENYLLCKAAFMGGFTHASNHKVGSVINSVDSCDLSSSYPSVMVAELFPMSRPKECKIKNLDEYYELAKNHCLIVTFKFEGLENKIGYESYISESRCHKVFNATIDNGRVYSAEKIVATMTCIDFEIMNKVYKWEKLSINKILAFRKGRLPRPIVESILELYVDKTELKDIAGKETEYLLSKGMLNSVYGMSVTDVLQNDIEFIGGEWKENQVDIQETIENYNTSKNRFLYYPWGIWVTAYARRNLWTAIIALGSDYIYSDTDSVKFTNYDKHKGYFERYNKKIAELLESACDDLGFDTGLLAPMNNKGDKKALGIWEHEGHFTHFKTLGSKRYMYTDGKRFNLVVAGLSKQNGMQYIQEKGDNITENIFSAFNDNLHIPAEKTGKMTHTYIDDSITQMVLDYNGNFKGVTSNSGIHLERCEFTLSISAQYKNFLKMLSQGYTFKGVKYI